MVLADFAHDALRKAQTSHAKYITQANFNDSSKTGCVFC